MKKPKNPMTMTVVQEPKKRGRVKGKKYTDPNETPARRFVRIAQRRTLEVMKSLSALENLTTCRNEKVKDDAGEHGYYYTPEQWEKVRKAIDRKLASLDTAISNRKPSNGESFKL